MILPNDLPAGYSGGQAHEILADQFKWVSNKGSNNLNQEIVMDNKQTGGVTVFVYENLIDAEKSYTEQVESLGDTNNILEDVGDEGVYVTLEMDVAGMSVKETALVFRRCNATINLQVPNTTDINKVSAYAKRLDERLQSLVCQ